MTEEVPRTRAFLLLRYTLIAATAYLILSSVLLDHKKPDEAVAC